MRRLTEPLFAPSCADVPLTLKLTPFGALDLMSILAMRFVSMMASLSSPRKLCTGSSMVEILA